MDNSTDKGDKENSSEELDLSGLQDFNFASNWSESKAPVSRERERSPRGGPRRERQPDRRPGGTRRPRPTGAEAGEARESRMPDRGQRQERPARREERPGFHLLRESPFEIQVFPEEPILATLTRAMRQSLRTYELFEVARLVLEKPDRFHVSLRLRENEGAGVRNLFQSVPDGLPFLSEDGAVDHVLRNQLETFFEVEEVEAEPPKGSFQFIARCTLSGDFLSPPNYHRYQSILLQYYQERFSHLSFEHFRSNIETVKDEEAIEKWLQSMTKQQRYKLRGAPEGEEKAFDSLEEARAFLMQNRKEQVVRSVRAVRLPGKKVEEISDPEIKPYVEAYAEHQKRFPLDTANTLRGRLRRQHFFIYKKGSKGISFVCAVKRKFRQPNQVFSETIGQLIAFIEQHDQVVASQLPEKFLGISPAVEGEAHSSEDEEKLKRLNLDLRWLLSEGYVTEYSDGRLSAHGVLQDGRGAQHSAEEETSEKSASDSPSRPEESGSAPDEGESLEKTEEKGDAQQESAAAEVGAESPAAEQPEQEKKDQEVSSGISPDRPPEQS